jgi:two-component system chemotaxis response regulator CheY
MGPCEGCALVVDDDNDLREAIRDALVVEGYDIGEARDGQEALAYLRSHDLPPLILLDWNMAPMDGARFMAEVSKDCALSAIPVVLLSACVGAAEKAIRHGFVGYLPKPINLDALLSIISRYCLMRANEI